ncbi:hypothetical protein ACFYNO_20200 [Kitasatospora sp. NPDC006697]|uniref:hypothetical protein n=1 Tax=Kitasatospora sp. NPDC006697 TaxID=3364020 RepID=UPI0036B0EE8D
MPHQPPSAAALAAAGTTTGFHPGPLFFVFWILVLAALVAGPVYLARLLLNRRKRR